jgi:hypothetical protein
MPSARTLPAPGVSSRLRSRVEPAATGSIARQSLETVLPRPSKPRPAPLLFIDQSGVALQVRRSALCVRLADGTEVCYPPRVHGFRTVILSGHGASITSEAVRWAARESVALYVMERNGEAFALFTSAVQVDGRRKALAIRQKQFAAVLDPRKRSISTAA